MLANCKKCLRSFDKYKEEYCKDCYELQILKGECLKIAAVSLRLKYNPESDAYIEKTFELTRKLFEAGKSKGFMKW